MSGINYLMSRIMIFVTLCVIWLAINGRLYIEAQSSPEEPTATSAPKNDEPPLMDNTRPVNLMIINDGTNLVAATTVKNVLDDIYKKNSDLIGRVLTIKVDGENPKDDLDHMCDVWDTLIKEQSSDVPDLVLDTTKSGYAGEIVSAFTAAIGIPTLSAQYGREGDIKNWRNLPSERYKYLVQIMPPADLISEAVKQFVHQMNISNAGVIFDEDFVMDRRYENLFNSATTRFVIMPMKNTEAEVRRLIGQFRRLDILNYFILGNITTIKTVLDMGQSLNFVGPQYGWYALSQYDPEPSCECRELSLIFLKPVIRETSRQRLAKPDVNQLLMEPLLTSAFYFDLTRLGIMAMKASILKRKWPTNLPHLSCEDFDGENTPIRHFDYYKELVDASAESTFQPTFAGFTWGGKNGRNFAKFDMTAKMLTIIRGNITKSNDLGIWRGGLHSNFKVKNKRDVEAHSGVLRYRITTVIKAPFVMYDAETGVWSGYCIDLIDKLATMLNFTYSIREVTDRKYGMMNEETGKWNGVIREIHEKRADIALGAVSVMAERESAVDFTVPFYELVGFSILMRKPKRATKLFKFLTVLSDGVWLCILGSYFVTSIFLSIFNRWSPQSYRNNLEKFKDDDEKRDFTFRESLWFSMTSLTPQGGGIAPKNLSGRVLSATWWLFGFIIIASYTANLSAFLTVSRLETMVESLEDLSKQYRIQYAPIMNSETHLHFKRMADIEERFYNIWRDLSLSNEITELERSKLAVWEYPASYQFTKIYQSMWEAKLPNNISEALDRIRRVNNLTVDFALVGDATDIKYLTMTNCDLIEVGSEFARKPYALAVQQGSPLREPLNNAILQLSNQRELEKLKDRWWDKNPKKLECEVEELLSDGISMANIGGIFLVTFAGIGLAILTLAFEYYWYRCRPNRKRNLTKGASDEVKAEGNQKVSPTKTNLKTAKKAFLSNRFKSRF